MARKYIVSIHACMPTAICLHAWSCRAQSPRKESLPWPPWILLHPPSLLPSAVLGDKELDSCCPTETEAPGCAWPMAYLTAHDEGSHFSFPLCMYPKKNQRPRDCPHEGSYGEYVVLIKSPHLAEQGSTAQSCEYSRLMQRLVHGERGRPADAAVLTSAL